MNSTRRKILGMAAMAPLAIAAGAAAAQQAPVCYDPATLPLSQRSRRRALSYTDASADPAKHCSLCSFFTASGAGCGSCQMLSGGPVNAGGLCTSFAPRAK